LKNHSRIVATERSSLLFCTLLSCSFPTQPPTSGAIREQQTEADRLNRKYGKRFRIFKGIESDIVALDYPDKVLKTFDFVVASVHSRFKMDRAAQTERIIRAVSNPYTTILGHMTGRQLLRRPGRDAAREDLRRHHGHHRGRPKSHEGI
jgi:DNA polymerase (family 10)